MRCSHDTIKSHISRSNHEPNILNSKRHTTLRLPPPNEGTPAVCGPNDKSEDAVPRTKGCKNYTKLEDKIRFPTHAARVERDQLEDIIAPIQNKSRHKEIQGKKRTPPYMRCSGHLVSLHPWTPNSHTLKSHIKKKPMSKNSCPPPRPFPMPSRAPLTSPSSSTQRCLWRHPEAAR